MLLLKRRVGESIRIGDDILITVRHISASRVSLEIHAPVETKILRQELLERQEERWPGGAGET